ncbi:hypothetical protein [Parasphingorhabdus pacifica]
MAAEKKPEVAKDGATETDKKMDISGAQVAGGALASATAAFLGSQLGVMGTVWGAGLTSVVITVGGALYQRSLENTKKKANVAAAKANAAAAKAALKRATRQTPAVPLKTPTQGIRVYDRTGQGISDAAPTRAFEGNAPEFPPATRRLSVSGEQSAAESTGERADPARTRWIRQSPSGMQWPGGEQVQEGSETTGDQPDDARTARIVVAERETEPHAAPPPTGSRRTIRWGMLAVTSSMVFGLGMLAVTGFEGLAGKPVSGGKSGTTVGHLVRPAPQPAARTEPVKPAEPEQSEQPDHGHSVQPEPAPDEHPESATSEQVPASEPSEMPTPASEDPATTDETSTAEPEITESIDPENGITGENQEFGG